MLLRHICEVCGKEEILTPEQAYDQGWEVNSRPSLQEPAGVVELTALYGGLFVWRVSNPTI